MKDMLKKFNTTETWIDVETLANLKGISKRAIRLSFNSKNSNYETKIENGKGGHLYKIRLSSVEEDLQIKYIHEYYDTLATTNNIREYILFVNLLQYWIILFCINVHLCRFQFWFHNLNFYC